MVNNPTHFDSQAPGFACVRVGKLKPLGESSGLKLARRAVEGREGLSWCYSTAECGKAGKRAGTTCAIDVEGFKRRAPSKVGGLCHEGRVPRLLNEQRLFKACKGNDGSGSARVLA